MVDSIHVYFLVLLFFLMLPNIHLFLFSVSAVLNKLWPDLGSTFFRIIVCNTKQSVRACVC